MSLRVAARRRGSRKTGQKAGQTATVTGRSRRHGVPVQDRANTFGYWLRRRRKALDLTQEALADRVACSVFSIRKLESDERRPSRRLAERLAVTLAIPAEERREFLEAARKLRSASRLALAVAPLAAADPPILPAAQPATTATDNSPFVGRGFEWALLQRLLERLPQGEGRTVLVEGEPGIGKSRLLRELARHARERGFPVLATPCYEIERTTPFQPVIDLVSRTLDSLPSAALAGIAPVSLAELAVLVPDLRERVAGLPELSNDYPEVRQARLPRAVDQLLELARRGRPAILMVDDIQWADAASAQLLQVLARRARERPVLVVYALRDEELDTNEPLARLVESLRRDAGATRVPLQRLGPEDSASLVAALVDSRLAVPGLPERLHRESEGNPFFLTSTLQSLNAGETSLDQPATGAAGWLPDGLRAAVRVRLAHVPQAFRPVLEAAAVLGRRFDFDQLLEVRRQPEVELLDALEALVKRRLLREEPEGGIYDFSHDKVREVVYRDIGGARRRLLHQGVAEALERRDDGHERDAQLAQHYEQAHQWGKALRHMVLAAQRSQALFAMRDALHWFDRALALDAAHPDAADPGRLLALREQRGAARAQAGLTQGAVEDFRWVVEAALAGGDRARSLHALAQLGMAYRRADAYDEATACLTEALSEWRAMGDQQAAADTLYHLGTVAWSTGRNDRAIGFHGQAVEVCERNGLQGLVAVQAWHGRGESHFANAEPEAAIACFNRSLVLARGIGDRSYESENLMMIGHACVGAKGLGDYPRALAQFDAALEIARAADLQWHMGPTLLGRYHVLACTGRYGEAWSGIQETLRWLESLAQVRYQMIAFDFAGHLLLDTGRNALVVEQMERGIALSDSTGIQFWRPALQAHLAIARCRLGLRVDPVAVRALLEQTRGAAERYLLVRCLDALAELLLADDDAQASLQCADELLQLATSGGLRELEAVGRRWRGEALLALGRLDDAQAELSHAAALAETIGRVRLVLDTQSALARLARAMGDAAAAGRHAAKARTGEEAIAASLLVGLPLTPADRAASAR